MKISVKLGTTTNLLYGYNASWLSDNQGNNALFPVTEKALKEVDINLTDTTAKWEFPEISLHDTPESLLNTLLPYKLHNPADDTKVPELNRGMLLIGDRDRDSAIQQLSQTLGADCLTHLRKSQLE